MPHTTVLALKTGFITFRTQHADNEEPMFTHLRPSAIVMIADALIPLEDQHEPQRGILIHTTECVLHFDGVRADEIFEAMGEVEANALR